MSVKLFIVMFSASLVSLVNSQLEIGDDCRTANGKAGTCKDPHASECHDWIIRQLKNSTPPSICSFSGSKPIICCSNLVVGGRLGILSDASRRSKSYQKCEEYSRVLGELDDIPVLTPTTIQSDDRECHVARDGTQLIVGGSSTVKYEFPHMAVLGFGPKMNINWACGGSLISERFVVTAAHCMYSRQNGNVSWVRLGDLDLESTADDEEAQQFGVAQRYKHPNYSARSNYDDIALLELDDDVVYSAAVRPACIHYLEGDNSEDLIATVTGWGKTSTWGSTSNILLKAELKFVSTATCRAKYSELAKTKKLSRNIDEETMMCAGDPKGKSDTCQGDSGGPIQLVLHEPDCMYVVVGVTSFGPSACAVGTTPAVYTRLKTYIPWIESIVWPD